MAMASIDTWSHLRFPEGMIPLGWLCLKSLQKKCLRLLCIQHWRGWRSWPCILDAIQAWKMLVKGHLCYSGQWNCKSHRHRHGHSQGLWLWGYLHPWHNKKCLNSEPTFSSLKVLEQKKSKVCCNKAGSLLVLWAPSCTYAYVQN